MSSLEAFREVWIVPSERRAMLGRLPDGGRSVLLVRALAEMTDFDLYDVLAELGYGLAPRTRPDRAEAFGTSTRTGSRSSRPTRPARSRR